MTQRTRRRSAFTLVEVLLVIVILGMLATVAIRQLIGTREGARIDTTKLLINNVATQMDLYNMHIGHYPTEEEGGLAAMRTKPQFADEKLADKWRGPYLKENPVDAWGHALNYEVVSPGSDEALTTPFKISSNGPDGQAGTDDDIKSWSDETAR